MLQRFVRAVGVGKVLGPYDYSKRYRASQLGSKPRYVVQYQNAADVEQVMSALDPYLSVVSPKRERYHELLAEAQLRDGGERPS